MKKLIIAFTKEEVEDVKNNEYIQEFLNED